MLILSFRDMSVPRCGAVTAAAMYDIDSVSAAFKWNPAPAFRGATVDIGRTLAGKHVCFLIHGFNVNRNDGYTSLGVLAQELGPGGALPQMPSKPHGPLDLSATGIQLAIPVLWSGDWYLPINYPFLLPDIRLTGRHFAEFLTGPGASIGRVSFVTHSMGARVAMEAIQQTMARASERSARAPAFDTVLLTAPAVSDDIFDDPDYANAVAAVRRFAVASSPVDDVLSKSFPAGNWVEQALWPRDSGADVALGLSGPQLKKNSKALAKTQWFEMPPKFEYGFYHGDYLPAPLRPAEDNYPNGWTIKRTKVAQLAQALLDGDIPAWPPSKAIVVSG